MRDDLTEPHRPDAETRSVGRPLLREALRRARVEAVEHTDVLLSLKHAEIARLETLRDALAPMLAEIPPEVDLFDIGLVPGDRPRLFVDMVSFVEMGRDRRLYRFLRDGRHGRFVAAESEQVEPIVKAVTDYVARRLVERERLLAEDDRLPDAAVQPAAAPAAAVSTIAKAQPAEAPPRRSSGWVRALAVMGAFAVGGAAGVVVVVGLMVAAAKGLLPGIG